MTELGQTIEGTSDRYSLPDDLDEPTIHGIEYTIPFTARNNDQTNSAPLLDALTTYREDELN